MTIEAEDMIDAALLHVDEIIVIMMIDVADTIVETVAMVVVTKTKLQ